MKIGICGKKSTIQFDLGFDLWEIKLGVEIGAKL